MEQITNPELKPQVEFPSSEEHEQINPVEQGLPNAETAGVEETTSLSQPEVQHTDESSVVTETAAVEVQPTLSEEQLEEEIKEDLIHKSLDEITNANEAVEALMNKETPADNLNALM